MRKWMAAAGMALLLFGSGCWSRIEVTDLGVVIGFAVDVGEHAPVRLTFFVSRAPGSGQMEGGAGRTQTHWVVARDGRDVADAMRQITRAAARRLSLHHLRVVLVGEAYARRDMSDLMDFLSRSTQVRLTTRMLMVHGKAADVLATPPHLEPLQPENIAEIVQAIGGPDPRFKEQLVARASETHSSWMYVVHLRERPVRDPGTTQSAVEVSGSALLRRDQVVRVLDLDRTRALWWLESNPKEMILEAPCPTDPAQVIAARVVEGKARIQPSLVRGQLRIQVNVEGWVDVINSQCHMNQVDPKSRGQLEERLQAQVEAEMKEGIAAFQESGTDPVGFGKRVQLRHTAYWRTIRKNWLQVWADTPVTIAAQITIRRTGLLVQPANRTRDELQREQQ